MENWLNFAKLQDSCEIESLTGVDWMPQQSNDKRVYLRQWVGHTVKVLTVLGGEYSGKLTNLAFEGQNRLMYIMLDDTLCLNFDQIVEISVVE